MNQYQKAMFRAYWFPVALFYVIPNAALLFIAWPISILDATRYFLPFPVALFLSGLILSPIFGPKVRNNRIYSFLLAFTCMFVALLIYIISMPAPNYQNYNFVPVISVFLGILGIFPALLGGLLYIGACDHVLENT